ncbi:MAG TPA: sigma-70 family RNA polymerase sigma factor, partial [Candidatus Binatia bacterium]|nr:sigma-70 family RNA polymerase sigma factor [Candidatus Binatia bacterium]
GQADRGSDPYQSFEIKRLRERMAELLTALPERERSIIRHHYFEHREFVVIAGMLEISKGRVAQLHARALQRLRDGYRESESVDKRV